MANIKKNIMDFSEIAIGAFLLALGTSFFLVPFKISTGGVGGLGTILYYVFGIPLSLTTLVVNLALFLAGFGTLRKASVVKTVAGIIFFSLFLEITQKFGMYTEDILIGSIFGGILVGVGVGLAVRKEASTGGSDFAALILHRFFSSVSVASFIMIIDSVIILALGIAFDNYTVMFYSVISLYISSKIIDMIVINGDSAKAVYILSKNCEKIADEIMQDMERGVTGIYSKGIYSGCDGMMLMCIVRSKEVPIIIDKIKRLDKAAFTVISDVRKVHGEGFCEIV